jgi:HSP20 family protein
MFFSPFGPNATRNPFRDLERLVEDLTAGFNRVLPSAPRSGEVPLNVWADDQGLVVTAEIAGIDPASISVDVLGDTVTISGKRPGAGAAEEAFTRTVHLPYRVDAERTEARSADGVLTIALQRPDAERPRTIPVKAA